MALKTQQLEELIQEVCKPFSHGLRAHGDGQCGGSPVRCMSAYRTAVPPPTTTTHTHTHTHHPLHTQAIAARDDALRQADDASFAAQQLQRELSEARARLARTREELLAFQLQVVGGGPPCAAE